MKMPLWFEASSSSQSSVTLLLCSSSRCRENVAEFVSSSLSSQSVSKALKLRQRKGSGEYEAECIPASSVWFAVHMFTCQGYYTTTKSRPNVLKLLFGYIFNTFCSGRLIPITMYYEISTHYTNTVRKSK